MKFLTVKLSDPIFDEMRKLYGVDDKEKYVAERRAQFKKQIKGGVSNPES